MRHKIVGKKLNRNTNQRKALFKTQIIQVLDKGSITTTDTKAKILKSKVEKILNKARDNSIHSVRQIESILSSKKASQKAIELAKRLEAKTGFVKLTRIGARRGDNTMMVRLDLILKSVETEEKLAKETKKTKAVKKETKKKTK